MIVMLFATTTISRYYIQMALEQVSLFGQDPCHPLIYPFQSDAVAYYISLCIVILLGDGIVVWRAWVICSRRWVNITLGICMVGSCIGIIFVIAVALQDVTAGRPIQVTAMLLFLVLPTFITNVIATLAIGHTVWVYERTIRANPDKVPTPVTVHRVLFFLLESGLLYMVLWITNAILVLIPSATRAFYYIHIAVTYMVDICPAAVIILVTQRTPPAESQKMPPHFSPTRTPSMISSVLNIGFEAEPHNLEPISV
ncbi:hypothetical protein C8J56DRAFT_893193 [Mycena floridula]|nr:hypothetical protein C8J56DRAFT_893193 [Mycena floridula]